MAKLVFSWCYFLGMTYITNAYPAPADNAVWSIESCVHSCLQNFMSSTGEATFGKGKSLEKLSWQEILDLSTNEDELDDMQSKFGIICESYSTLKICLRQCPNTKLHDTIIHGFASLEYICNSNRQEFMEYMPCLAKHEKTVMLQCKRETNQTLIATQVLQKAAFQNNLDDFRHLLRHLCRNTTQIIECMTPATERACGERPAAMLRHLVALSFNNIENLYAHLGLHDQLPIECRELGQMTEANYETEQMKLSREITDRTVAVSGVGRISRFWQHFANFTNILMLFALQFCLSSCE